MSEQTAAEKHMEARWNAYQFIAKQAPDVTDPFIDMQGEVAEVLVLCKCMGQYRAWVEGKPPIPSNESLSALTCPHCNRSALDRHTVSGHSAGVFNVTSGHVIP
jgi:hypothetical protein